MAFALTNTGLSTQSLQEIKTELEAAFQTAFGNNINVATDSVFGQLIGILAERESLIQQKVLSVYESVDPNTASGTKLDTLSSLTATERKEATNSKSAAGRIDGTPGTVVVDGRQVRLEQTNDVWSIVDGPYVIPAAGFLESVSIQAEETGPKTFLTTDPVGVDPLGWAIETPVSGWDSFQTVADIDPEDTGRNTESDAELRARRFDELFIRGNDLSAIKAVVQNVLGVTAVSVFENQDCTQFVDGIAPGAFEVVVDGGNDQEIGEAIFSRKPPGAEAFGSSSVAVDDGEGGTLQIGFTRPTDIDIYIEVTATALGAEAPFPSGGVQAIADAVLAYGNSTAEVGRDVIPKSFYASVFESVRTDSGLDTLTDVVVGLSLVPGGPFVEAVVPIAIRERADFDSANISVVLVAL